MSPRCLTVFEQSCKSKRTLRDLRKSYECARFVTSQQHLKIIIDKNSKNLL